MTWLSENELAAGWFVELMGRIGERASGIGGAIAQFVRDYGQSIVGLIGVTFGFWRWWRYREHILHKRLAEYLRENDSRLADGTAQLIEAIQRPAPGQKFKDPLFIDDDLRSVLRERNWDSTMFALSVETSADWQLSKAIESIKRRLSTAHDVMESLHRQLTSAYSIRGAVAASSAHRRGEDAGREALEFFRSALAVPGNVRNLQLKELEAHQLRKLRLKGAKQAYREIIGLAEGLEQPRERNFLTARAKRYLAEIVEPVSSKNAYRMMTAQMKGSQFYPGALALLSHCEPYSAWERIEKADMHYFTAYCASELGFRAVVNEHLAEAETFYRGALSVRPRSRWFMSRHWNRLRAQADAGIACVHAARNGKYETGWLHPPLQEAH